MRICMLARSIPVHAKGGLEDHTMMICQGLVQKGHEVILITTQHPQGKEYEVSDGVEIYYTKGTIPGKYSWSWCRRSVQEFIRLHTLKKFDVVHGQSGGGIPFLLKGLNRKYNIPTVISLHGTTIDEIKSACDVLFSSYKDIRNVFLSMRRILYHLYNYSFVSRRALMRADAIIATSNEQVKRIKILYQTKDSDLYVVYNGIDTDLFAPKSSTELKEKYKINQENKIILGVARLTKEKGIQNIILSMPAILKSIHEAKLIIVGNGNYRKDLELLIDKLGLKEHIFITGLVPYEELPLFYNLADVFVNATIRVNGYDLTILQAMACEKPVIVSNLGSVPTVITHNEDGILVSPGDVRILTQEVIRILKDKELAANIGKKARKKIVSRFSLESMTEELI
ncbi:MAG: glycosyltransferase family 4 protein, partial [bacterium]|nr:glycosyltransferase family 4 protein [bacterium]